ncbi:MAG TPA: dihydrofolate reductase family protein, partial [Solirubrobacterales bacterium]|nr:dihydrofolate reductase family protein [Solirubrobacterales bacterium]
DRARLDALRDAGAEPILAAPPHAGAEPIPAAAAPHAAAGPDPSAPGAATSAERIAAALAELGRRGLTSLLLEGGATLAAAFAAAGQIDEARVFVAPLLLGGPAADVPVAALQGSPTEAETVGEDTLIRTRFKEW